MEASIIILNFNYARFLRAAIDSALQQKCSCDFEVIVVDDGSTDDSRDIIHSYKERVRGVFQENQGMMGASNAGFSASSGRIIFFLDADDYLTPDAVELVRQKWVPEIAMIHWRLKVVNHEGVFLRHSPNRRYCLARGDLRMEMVEKYSYVTSPTSGNAYSRWFLDKVFPLPNIHLHGERGYRAKIPTDAYLKGLVPFEGKVESIERPLGYYRSHGNNNAAGTSVLQSASKRKRSIWLMNRDQRNLSEFAKDNNVSWCAKNMLTDYYRCRGWCISMKTGEAVIEGLDWESMRLVWHVFRSWPENWSYGVLRSIWLAWSILIIIAVPRQLVFLTAKCFALIEDSLFLRFYRK